MPKKLKIAVLIRDFVTTGGAERYACEVTRRLAPEHEVHVFCQNWNPTISEEIAFHRIPKLLAKPSFVNQLLFSFFTRRALAVPSTPLISSTPMTRSQHLTC